VPLPEAVTLNVATAGSVTVWSAGCTAIDGDTGAGVTVSVTGVVVSDCPLADTTARYCAPFCVGVAPEMVSVVAVAPAMSAQTLPLSTCH
jgi:hypothetical protein